MVFTVVADFVIGKKSITGEGALQIFLLVQTYVKYHQHRYFKSFIFFGKNRKVFSLVQYDRSELVT